MKRSVSLLLTFVLILLPCLTLLSGCGTKGVYKITFSVNGEKTVVEVPAGEIPEYPGETSWETSEHFYKITGWDKEFAPATSNATYTAKVGEYGLTIYEVLFVLPSGIVAVPTHEGEVPTPPEGYETDQTREYEIGVFEKWDKELTAPNAANTANGKKKMSYTPTYTYEPRYVATLLAVKDGAKGIFTMTYDDGIYSTAKWVNEKNKIYGTKGSCMMIPNHDGHSPNFGDRVSEWNAIFSDGTLEPECHSMTHGLVLPSTTWGSYEGSKYNNIKENYDVELVQSKAFIEAAFPGYNVLCFAPSNNTLSTFSFKSDGNGNLVKNADGSYVVIEDGGAQAVANATYFAIRQGQRGAQSLDPAPTADPGGWYNLRMQSFRSTTDQDQKLALGKGYLDETVKDGKWLIIMCHGITASGDGGDIKQSHADQFLSYASDYIKAGKLWAATFGEATKYIRERQNTTVSERYDKESGVVYVDMKINRTTSEGKKLDESIFNYPLTVEARVPDTWTSARYTDGNGKAQVAVPYTRDGRSYVMVNLIPGADGATVTTELRALGTK